MGQSLAQLGLEMMLKQQNGILLVNQTLFWRWCARCSIYWLALPFFCRRQMLDGLLTIGYGRWVNKWTVVIGVKLCWMDRTKQSSRSKCEVWVGRMRLIIIQWRWLMIANRCHIEHILLFFADTGVGPVIAITTCQMMSGLWHAWNESRVMDHIDLGSVACIYICRLLPHVLIQP